MISIKQEFSAPPDEQWQRWLTIQDSFPECFQALIQLGEAIYINRAPSIQWEADLKVLQPAIDHKIVGVAGNRVWCTSMELSREAVAEYIVQKHLLDVCEKGELSPIVAKIQTYTRQLQDRFDSRRLLNNIVERALVLLHEKYEQDIMQIFSKEHQKGAIRKMLQPLNDIWPFLSTSTENRLQFLENLKATLNKSQTSTSLPEAIFQFAVNQPEAGLLLHQSVVKNPTQERATFISSILKGLAHLEFAEAYEHARALAQHDHEILKRAGLEALGNLNYSEEFQDQLEKTLHEFRENMKHSNPSIVGTVIHGYGQLLTQTAEACDKIVALAERTEPELQFHLVGTLRRWVERYHDAKWFASVFLALSTTDSKAQETMYLLDSVLGVLIEKNDALAECFLQEWVRQQNISTYGFLRFFGPAFQVARKKNMAFLETLVTRWLLEEDTRFHACVTELTNQLSTEHCTELSMDQKLLQGCNASELAQVLERILRSVGGSAYLSSLSFSLLQAAHVDASLSKKIMGVFSQNIAIRSKERTQTFLKTRLMLGSETEKELAKTILQTIR